jgi:alkaline phosphatase
LAALTLALLGCAGGADESNGKTSPVAGPTSAAEPGPTGASGQSARRGGGRSRRSVAVVAAGDISCAGVCGQDDTAKLVQKAKPNAVLGLGDFQYETGTSGNFASYYNRFWGRFKSKTYAINGGRHDFYGTGDYLRYFNDGGPVKLTPQGSYSFDLGRWHLIALNSYCFERDSCDASAWTRWLGRDLARHRNRCSLAFWHEPYWTSPSHHEPDTSLKPWVSLLYRAGVDVVLEGHNHAYERFRPQDPNGRFDRARGITAFMVGTGGTGHYDFHGGSAPNSVVRNDKTFGVLRLELAARGYRWRFLPVAGQSFTDAGSARCH